MPRQDAPRRAGRPARTSAEKIQSEALPLFLRHGYASMSMGEIASRIGVGRTTMFRYFPTKADLVWFGFDVHVEFLRLELAKAPTDAPVLDALDDAVVAAFESSRDDEGTWLVRFRILQEAVELHEAGWVRWANWRKAVASFVRSRTVEPKSDIVASAVAGAVLGIYLAIHEEWAAAPGLPSDPSDDLRRALEPTMGALAALFPR